MVILTRLESQNNRKGLPRGGRGVTAEEGGPVGNRFQTQRRRVLIRI